MQRKFWIMHCNSSPLRQRVWEQEIRMISDHASSHSIMTTTTSWDASEAFVKIQNSEKQQMIAVLLKAKFSYMICVRSSVWLCHININTWLNVERKNNHFTVIIYTVQNLCRYHLSQVIEVSTYSGESCRAGAPCNHWWQKDKSALRIPSSKD